MLTFEIGEELCKPAIASGETGSVNLRTDNYITKQLYFRLLPPKMFPVELQSHARFINDIDLSEFNVRLEIFRHFQNAMNSSY